MFLFNRFFFHIVCATRQCILCGIQAKASAMRVWAGVCFTPERSIVLCFISLRMVLEKQLRILGVFYYTQHTHSLEKSSPLVLFQFHWSFRLHQARRYCPWGQRCAQMDLLALPLRIWSKSRKTNPWPWDCLPLSVRIPLWLYSGQNSDWVKPSLFCSTAVGWIRRDFKDYERYQILSQRAFASLEKFLLSHDRIHQGVSLLGEEHGVSVGALVRRLQSVQNATSGIRENVLLFVRR